MSINIKKSSSRKSGAGFTLMEILVATTLFAFVSVATSELFVSTLRLNRRSDAMRQSAESIRDFVEFLVKDVRNGQVDYGFVEPNAMTVSANYPLGPCAAPAVGSATYSVSGADNKLGLINADGTEECIYLAFGPGGKGNLGDYVGSGIFTSDTTQSDAGYNPSPILAVVKTTIGGTGTTTPQTLNPANSRVDAMSFFVRPASDPYYTGGTLVEVQPFVMINLKFTTSLATGEQVPIYYQTSVSTNKYDVPPS